MKTKTTFIFLIFCLNSFSQNNIEIHVLNTSNLPLSKAKIEIFQKDRLVYSGVTNKQGFVNIEIRDLDSFRLNCKFENIDTSFNFLAISSKLKIYLNTYQTRKLKVIEVKSSKPFITKKTDRISINPDALTTSAGLSSWDILNKIPSVTTSQNDQISIRGKEGTIIYIDDRPTYMSSADLANYLKSLPSSSLSTIEILTNPSARYEASGGSGIIIFKLKKSEVKGVLGNISVNYGQGFYARTNNSANLNYRVNSFNFFTNASVSETNFFQDLNINRAYFHPNNDLSSIFNQNSFLKISKNGVQLRVGTDYYISSKSTFGILFTGFSNADNREVSNNSWIRDSQSNVTSIVNSQNPTQKKFRNFGAMLNYDLKLDTNGKILSLNFDNLRYQSEQFQNLNSIFRNPQGDKLKESFLLSELPTNINIISAKSDITIPIQPYLKFDFGAKWSQVATTNNAIFYDLIGNTKVKNESFSNNFNYKENIAASYINFSLEKKKWSVQTGLRYEHTTVDGLQYGHTQLKDSSFQRDYGSFFPTIYLTYKLDSNEDNSIGLSYGRRIDRPNYQDMNPFTYPLDLFTLYGGNSFLKPSFTQTIEINFNNKNTIQTALYYSQTEDMITETIEQGANIFYSRPGNIGSEKQIGLSLGLSKAISKSWQCQLNSDICYSSYSARLYQVNLENQGFFFNLKTSNQIQLPNKWMAELSFMYQSTAPSAQFIIIPAWSVDIGISKKIFKEKINLKLAFNDVFYSYRPGGNIVGLSQSTANWVSKLDTRLIQIALGYRFSSGKSIANRKYSASDEEKARVKF